jgi:hypothetical protein
MAIDKRLLIHWWHYYGKVIYTFAELEEFEKVIDKYGADKVLDVAVASHDCKKWIAMTWLNYKYANSFLYH